jgi:hypothetical protein
LSKQNSPVEVNPAFFVLPVELESSELQEAKTVAVKNTANVARDVIFRLMNDI